MILAAEAKTSRFDVNQQSHLVAGATPDSSLSPGRCPSHHHSHKDGQFLGCPENRSDGQLRPIQPVVIARIVRELVFLRHLVEEEDTAVAASDQDLSHGGQVGDVGDGLAWEQGQLARQDLVLSESVEEEQLAFLGSHPHGVYDTTQGRDSGVGDWKHLGEG